MRRLLFASGLTISLCIGAAAAEPSLAELLPRIPPHEPQDALKTFTLQRGFTLELVASEPDVVNPIDAAFDEDGRMYVIEMSDYPFLPAQRPAKYVARQPEAWGSIRRLEDIDGDGRMDKSVVFAEKLRWPQSVICYRGGVFVLTPPSLLYLQDTNGDGVADMKEEWFRGFSAENVQGLANGMEWHPDHGIYFAGGRAGAEIFRGDEKLFQVGRRDLRLDPATKVLTPVSGGEQYGHSIDDWGNRFVCNNSNHLEQVVMPLQYLDRNPQLTAANIVRTIAKEGAAATVFRQSPPEPWRVVRTARRILDPKFRATASPTEQVATGFFTSATGVTIYRGGAYPPEFYGNAFIGDVGGNLVHRKKLTPNGITLLGERTEDGVEFLTSSDNWFRPANFVNAPDGTLYVLDMYWETIEHPASIPEDIKEHLDLESGNDRGRVYRLVSPNMPRFKPPKMSGMTTVELVAQLESPHGCVRDTAHRLIWERQDLAAVEPLRKLLKDGKSPQARALALWSLQGISKLDSEAVIAGLVDADPHVREQAIRLAEDVPGNAARSNREKRASFGRVRLDEDVPAKPSPLLEQLLKLTNDPDVRVRWQLAMTLGEFEGPKVTAALLTLVKTANADADLRVAVLSSIGRDPTEFALALLDDPETRSAGISTEILRMAGATSDEVASEVAAQVLLSKFLSPTLQHRHLLAVGEGLRRRGGSLAAIASKWPDDGKTLKPAWQRHVDNALQAATLTEATVPERVAAVQFLSLAKPTLVTPALATLLIPQTAPELQLAAVKTLLMLRDRVAEDQLLAQWKGLGPAARKEAIDGLTQSRSGAAALVAAVAGGTVRAGELDRDKQQLLMNYPQPDVRDQARQLLGGATSNRKEVVAKYQPALGMPGDAVRGQAVYAKICFQCHKAGTAGHNVGPDMASVQNKSPDDLLIAILDPNREAQPSFVSYTAVTENGQVYTGLIAAETAASVTLRRAEAKEDVVLRSQLDELVSNGVSLMPEGMEKDLSPEQIADVIAFIKALAPAAR